MTRFQRTRKWFLAALLLLLFPPNLHAQAHDRIFVSDPTRDHIMSFRDLDNDGQFHSPGESSVYYSDVSAGPNLSVPVDLEPFKGGLLLLDGGTLDAVLTLRDLDGDQSAGGDNEWTTYFDNSSSGPDLVVPRGMAISPDGMVFIVDEGSSARRVIRLHDENEDGDALDDGESWIYFDSESFSPSVPIDEPVSVAVAPDGSVYVGDSEYNWVFRCQDIDGDGTAGGEEECNVFFSPPIGMPLENIEDLCIDHLGRLVIIDGPSGSVLICEDLDGDGDGMDSGEYSIFVDSSLDDGIINDPRAILQIAPGRFLVADSDLDGIVQIEDLDGDGSASGVLEQVILFEDDSFSMPNPTSIAFLPGITIDSLDPVLIDAIGGKTLSIFGSGWTEGEVVEIEVGPLSLTGVAIDIQQVEVSIPASSPGTYDVSVAASGGTATLPGALEVAHQFLRGDVDGDLVVGLSDGIRIISHTVGVTEDPISCLDSADTNDDGVVSLADAILLLSYLFTGGDAPWAPFPGSGFDPTSGNPGCEFPE